MLAESIDKALRVRGSLLSAESSLRGPGPLRDEGVQTLCMRRSLLGEQERSPLLPNPCEGRSTGSERP